MKAQIKNLRRLLDLYGSDAAGFLRALDRQATAEILRKDARDERRLSDCTSDAAELERSDRAARRLSAIAAATEAPIAQHERDKHAELVRPRLSATGPNLLVWADSASELARASAGCVSRLPTPGAVVLRGDRGRMISHARGEGLHVESRTTRRSRSRKNAGRLQRREESRQELQQEADGNLLRRLLTIEVK